MQKESQEREGAPIDVIKQYSGAARVPRSQHPDF
jgi:hypothetical protein